MLQVPSEGRQKGERARREAEEGERDEMASYMMTDDFQHIIRVLNTNIEGKDKVMYALTKIKGIGRRFADVTCKKAEVSMEKRAGELTAQELEALMVIVSNPRQFRIPDWFLNRQKVSLLSLPSVNIGKQQNRLTGLLRRSLASRTTETGATARWFPTRRIAR